MQYTPKVREQGAEWGMRESLKGRIGGGGMGEGLGGRMKGRIGGEMRGTMGGRMGGDNRRENQGENGEGNFKVCLRFAQPVFPSGEICYIHFSTCFIYLCYYTLYPC